MPLFASASRAAVVELVCPRCGERQLRAREKRGHVYACKKCGHRFAAGEKRGGR